VLGSVVRADKSHSSREKPKILTQNRKNPEMTVPISRFFLTQNRKNPEMTVPIS